MLLRTEYLNRKPVLISAPLVPVRGPSTPNDSILGGAFIKVGFCFEVKKWKCCQDRGGDLSRAR
jgi:hypothetical protein